MNHDNVPHHDLMLVLKFWTHIGHTGLCMNCFVSKTEEKLDELLFCDHRLKQKHVIDIKGVYVEDIGIAALK